MGKFEVLSYLQLLRKTGDENYYRHCEIHAAMRRHGISFSFTSVWRSINSLFSDGLLEVYIDAHGLQRTAKFRARIQEEIISSQTQKVYNITGVMAENHPGDDRKMRSAKRVATHG